MKVQRSIGEILNVYALKAEAHPDQIRMRFVPGISSGRYVIPVYFLMNFNIFEDPPAVYRRK